MPRCLAPDFRPHFSLALNFTYVEYNGDKLKSHHFEFDAPFEKSNALYQGGQGGGSRHQHVPPCWVRPVEAFGWHRIVLRHVIAGLTNPIVAHGPSVPVDNRNRSATSYGPVIAATARV